MRWRLAAADSIRALRVAAATRPRLRHVRWLAWVAALRVTLPWLKHLLPLDRLVRVVHVTTSAAEPPAAVAWRVVMLERWLSARSPLLPANCLERSLIVHGTIAAGTTATSLVVGFRRSAGLVEGHTWVTVDGRVILEPADTPCDFTSTCAFDGTGARVDVPVPRAAAC